jgi:hypothetical protein
MSTHSRKSDRVYRSPRINEPSPFSKPLTKREASMDIDAEDEEAGTILMALAQHAERILNHPQHKVGWFYLKTSC